MRLHREDPTRGALHVEPPGPGAVASIDDELACRWRVWRGEYWLQYRQNDEINPAMYPNGLADVQAFKNSLGTDGRTLMFHYLSGNIGEEDPEFTKPNVSADLQSWGTVTLTAPDAVLVPSD